jgi:hypothetical protein
VGPDEYDMLGKDREAIGRIGQETDVSSFLDTSLLASRHAGVCQELALVRSQSGPMTFRRENEPAMGAQPTWFPTWSQSGGR